MLYDACVTRRSWPQSDLPLTILRPSTRSLRQGLTFSGLTSHTEPTTVTQPHSGRTFGEAAARAHRFVGVMQDLSGPKMRTGRLAGATIVLREGQLLRLAAGDFEGGPDRVAITAPHLISTARPDDRLLIDDSRLEVRVVAREADALVTRVVYGGPLGEHKGINAPGVALPVNALTPKDEADLEFRTCVGRRLRGGQFCAVCG